VYYRIISPDSIRMANAVDLAELAAKRPYYTDTAALQEAIEKNNAENSRNFIQWGIVYPMQRE
jgi:hypothetical protein